MTSHEGLSGGKWRSAVNPAVAQDPSQQPTRWIKVKEEDPAQCAAFEGTLVELAGRLSNAGDDRFDEVVIGCLKSIVEILGFDRSTLMAFDENGLSFHPTHSWSVPGVPAVSNEAMIHTKLPWFTRQIRSGHIVSVSGAIDLPSAATQERAYLLQSGLQSTLAVPLLMEGEVIGALAFGSFHERKRWSLGLVSRLRLAAEIIAMGVRRHQYAQGLKTISQSMNQLLPTRSANGRNMIRSSRNGAIRLMQAENRERRQMGQVLHEDVMQILSAVGMMVKSGEKETLPESAASKAIDLLRDAVHKLRQLTMELRPEEVSAMNITDGFRWLAGQVRRRYDLDLDVRIHDAMDPVADDVRNFLYDSARKLLENVAVHASCKRATLEVQRVNDCIQLTVCDEGVGFNPASLQDIPVGAFGLFSIREQAELLGGSLDVESVPGRGTCVTINVPLNE